MTTISRLQQALVELKARLPSNAAHASGARQGASAARSRSADPSRAALTNESEVGLKLDVLDVDQPGFAERSRRALLETVLTRELGDNIALDPRFGALVEKVAIALEQDPDVSAQIDALVRDLMGSRTPGAQ